MFTSKAFAFAVSCNILSLFKKLVRSELLYGATYSLLNARFSISTRSNFL